MKTFGRGLLPIISVIGVAAALFLAACGGSDNGTSATAASSTAGNDTVGVASIDGNDVLVDANGNALYSPDQEASGKILCTGDCTSEWMPLTVSGSQQPTASGDVSGQLGTVKRPDGGEQVTLDGKPLYTFVEDGGPGNVTGDGFADSFGNQDFTWHVITSSGSSGGSSTGTTTTSGSSGGYGY